MVLIGVMDHVSFFTNFNILFTTAHLQCNSHSINISTYRVQGVRVRARVQVSRNEIHTHIYLDQVIVEFLSCIKIKIKTYYLKVMLQSQIILQYFYKLLMYPTSNWFSSRPTINITFSFTSNHSPYQQFIKFFVKKFVSLPLLYYILTLIYSKISF